MPSREAFLKAYPDLIALAGGFTTQGYCLDFVERWFDARSSNGDIESADGKLSFSHAFARQLLSKL